MYVWACKDQFSCDYLRTNHEDLTKNEKNICMYVWISLVFGFWFSMDVHFHVLFCLTLEKHADGPVGLEKPRKYILMSGYRNTHPPRAYEGAGRMYGGDSPIHVRSSGVKLHYLDAGEKGSCTYIIAEDERYYDRMESMTL